MKHISRHIATAAIIVVATTGCSVWDKVTGRDTASSAKTPAATPVESAPERTTHPVVVLPQAQQQAEAAGAAEPDTIAQAEPRRTKLSELERIIGGQWTIVSVGSTVIDRDDDMPYIVFVPSEQRFYANNGCNTLNGAYTVENAKITFHNVLTTLRYCEDVAFDHQINTIIADETATAVKISEEGNRTILDFVTSTGKVLMQARRDNLDFLNGQWNITAVAGLANLAEAATVFFDLNDLKLHGNTGCNFINGEIYIDHRRPDAIDFSNIITTLRACRYPQQQTAILVALEQAETVVSDGDDKALILGPDNVILLELKRAKQ